MPNPVCGCPRCRRIRELTAKLTRGHEVLESGEGYLLLNVFEPTGGTSTIRVDGDDPEGMEEAISVLEEEIQAARTTLELRGHGRGRRRRIRSRWMER